MNGQAEAAETRCWISLGAHDVEIQTGETIIGRHDTCHLVLDDPLASRRHAALQFNDGILTLEDLGSVNGVLVNGRRIKNRRALQNGDEVRLGDQRIVVQLGSSIQARPRKRRLGAETLTNVPVSALGDDESTVVREGEALDTLALVAEKVLAMGRGVEAERILRKALWSVRDHVKRGEVVDSETLKTAAEYAVRLAEATDKWEWIDYAFELYTHANRVLPGPVIDRLYNAVRGVSEAKVSKLQGYLMAIRMESANLGPSERFLLRRIEGLEGLAGL